MHRIFAAVPPIIPQDEKNNSQSPALEEKNYCCAVARVEGIFPTKQTPIAASVYSILCLPQSQPFPKLSNARTLKMVSFVPLLGKVHFGLKQRQFSKAK